MLDEVVSDFEPDPDHEAEIRGAQLLEYAQCMREHGIDMPDPTFDEDGGGLVIGQEADIDVDSDEFRAADDECGGGGGMETLSRNRGWRDPPPVACRWRNPPSTSATWSISCGPVTSTAATTSASATIRRTPLSLARRVPAAQRQSARYPP